MMLFVIQLYFANDLELMSENALSGFKGNPKMELLFVMIVLPVTLNSIQVMLPTSLLTYLQYWIQDNFLQGNKYIEERAERLAQLEKFRIVGDDFVLIDPDMEIRPSRLNRQIEEAIYNIKPEDYKEDGELREPGDIVEDDVKSSADFYKNKEEKKQ